MDASRDGYLLPTPLHAPARWSHGRIVALAVGISIVVGSYHDDVTTVVLTVKPNGGP